jgi:16S rRNA (guanine527-N7)-methyltransferase
MLNPAFERSQSFNISTRSDSLPLFNEVWQSTLNWQPTPQQSEQFQALYAAILNANQSLNLTRITEPNDFWEKHLWDSLVGIASFLQTPEESQHFKVIDIGTGGGFPGLPIAIVRSDWSVTLLDSTQKKVAFLQHVQTSLDLKHITAIAGRAEVIGHDLNHRHQYDLACIRAVGGASVCAEYALPLLKTGGFAILYRGQWTPEEAAQLAHAVQILGGTIERIESVEIPLSKGVRHLVYLRKQKPTPNTFPRAIGIPAKAPLSD